MPDPKRRNRNQQRDRGDQDNRDNLRHRSNQGNQGYGQPDQGGAPNRDRQTSGRSEQKEDQENERQSER